jgi:plastocyanin
MSLRARTAAPALLALAATAVVLLASVAQARTKTVLTGGPPPGAQAPKSVKFPDGLDLNGFFRRTITINVGDSVRWIFSRAVVHTVAFLAPGQKRPPLETQDPAHPYTGFNDAGGAPFWFNGQPSVVVPPEHAFRQGGGSTDGRHYRNAGLSAPTFTPYKLRFTRAGTFGYICLVHPGMHGTVRVLPRGRRVPSARADRAAAVAEIKSAVKLAGKLAAFEPTGNNVVAAHDRGPVAWFRFFPAERTIRAGETVHFSISSVSEIHTISFGPSDYREEQAKNLIMPIPQPPGPPRIQFNPAVFLPSDPPPTLPPYTGSNHGNGFLNTGPLDTNPATPLPPSADVTFTQPGTYEFECTIHPGMKATITVT